MLPNFCQNGSANIKKLQKIKKQKIFTLFIPLSETYIDQKTALKHSQSPDSNIMVTNDSREV